MAGTAHVLRDPQVELVLDRLYYEAQIKAEEAKKLLRETPDVADDAHLRPKLLPVRRNFGLA
jgi:hypothetical protein